MLWLAFDRPHASNAIDSALGQAFAAALDDAARDPAVGAIIMTGAGDKVFSAGIDIKNPDGIDHEALSARRRDTVGKCLSAIVDFEKPLVAAVNGPAIGLAWMLVLLADRVIASERASFSLPEIDIGIPTFLGISIVTRAAGAALARELVLTGRRMDAAEAKQRGLVAQIESAAGVRHRGPVRGTCAGCQAESRLCAQQALARARPARRIRGGERAVAGGAAAVRRRQSPLILFSN